MPTFRIEQREKWETFVIYEVDADSEEQASELTENCTHSYAQYEVLIRDCRRLVNIEEVQIN
jgi:hypothetical protein